MGYSGCCGSCQSYYGSNNPQRPFANGFCDVRQIDVFPSTNADDCPYYRPDYNNDDDNNDDNDYYW